jgi:hypothetical protein
MVTLFLIISLLFAQDADTCPAYSIVRNGLTAFATGTPQIGRYTDAPSYLAGGLKYIEKRCGTAWALAFVP